MQVNKNSILVQSPKKRNRKRKAPKHRLQLRRFELIDDEAEVEVVVPCFSPILEVLEKDGWREVK